MLVLERKGNEVYCDGRKLTVVAQASKGPGKECVSIKGLEGSNGQKWVSLSRLAEGLNEIECTAREVKSSQKYTLTAEEAQEVKELQARIDEIVAAAKARYVKKPSLDVDPSKMTEEERQAKIAELVAYYGLKA